MMMPGLTIAPPADQRELDALMTILGEVFRATPEHLHRYVQNVGAENFRLLRAGKDLVGGLAMLPMGQFFGGTSVPMVGVALVGIAPHQRAGGAGTALMSAMLRELAT